MQFWNIEIDLEQDKINNDFHIAIVRKIISTKLKYLTVMNYYRYMWKKNICRYWKSYFDYCSITMSWNLSNLLISGGPNLLAVFHHLLMKIVLDIYFFKCMHFILFCIHSYMAHNDRCWSVISTIMDIAYLPQFICGWIWAQTLTVSSIMGCWKPTIYINWKNQGNTNINPRHEAFSLVIMTCWQLAWWAFCNACNYSLYHIKGATIIFYF